MGGYYAIKGFVYQFDKSILEILANKSANVTIEQIQDIGINDYYIQVKYKETQTFSYSKVKKAIIQLFEEFIIDQKTKFHLYCYFKDKSPSSIKLTSKELEKILPKNKGYFKNDILSFSKNFSLEFSTDFIHQFEKVITEIKTSFSLKSDEEAIAYHGILRARLLEIALERNPRKRTVSFGKINKFVSEKEKVIFYLAYSKYLKYAKYLAFLKKEYFMFKKVNIPCEDRLFVFDFSEFSGKDFIEVVYGIQKKYYKTYSSPAPYVCLLKTDFKIFSIVKSKLWDKKILFYDGTHFDGDRFRIEDLVKETHNQNFDATFKLLTEKELPALLKKKSFEKVFVFTDSPSGPSSNFRKSNVLYLRKIKDVVKLL